MKHAVLWFVSTLLLLQTTRGFLPVVIPLRTVSQESRSCLHEASMGTGGDTDISSSGRRAWECEVDDDAMGRKSWLQVWDSDQRILQHLRSCQPVGIIHDPQHTW